MKAVGPFHRSARRPQLRQAVTMAIPELPMAGSRFHEKGAWWMGPAAGVQHLHRPVILQTGAVNVAQITPSKPWRRAQTAASRWKAAITCCPRRPCCTARVGLGNPRRRLQRSRVTRIR